MPNNKDATSSPFKRILNVGRTGAGKSTQLWTLPGKKFLYAFDPNTLSALEQRDKRGNRIRLDIEYETFLPDVLEVDATLKGFNKGSKDDKMFDKSKREPTAYMRFVEDINKRVDDGYFNDFNWICFDSFTFISKATMARQLFINERYGGIEELGDYRVVGSKISEVFSSISALPINIYATGHINVFQDEKTKKLETMLNLPGSAKNMIPLVFTDVWQAETGEDKNGALEYQLRTKPDPRGLKEIRSSVPLKEIEVITIQDFGNPEQYGIGALLQR